jgi:hypothetical protein
MAPWQEPSFYAVLCAGEACSRAPAFSHPHKAMAETWAAMPPSFRIIWTCMVVSSVGSTIGSVLILASYVAFKKVQSRGYWVSAWSASFPDFHEPSNHATNAQLYTVLVIVPLCSS